MGLAKLRLLLVLMVCAAALKSEDDLDKHSSISMKPDETRTLHISSNPSTGYMWSARIEPDNLLSVDNPAGTFVALTPASGAQTFTVACKAECKPGDSAQFILDLQRGDEEPRTTRKVTIKVS